MRPITLACLLALAGAAPAAAQATVCPTPPVPGRQQSPVDIRRAVPEPLRRLRTHYPTVPGTAINDGHRVQVNVTPGDTITIDGVPFALGEFHFHWPGEHKLVGDSFPVEIHMVHRDAAGKIAVLGTWVRRSPRDNPAWDSLWAHLPREGETVPMTVNIHRLFGFTDLNAERVYRYCGSLTTGENPPYAEGVTWLVRRTAIPMSQAQIDKLHSVMHRYSRDVQPLNGRIIRYRRPGG